jgi:integrase
MAWHTEFRASELLSPIWEDVGIYWRGMTVRAAYAKNGERHSVPMNEVLTATLQAVRMSTLADGPVSRSRTGKSYLSLRTAFAHAVRQAGMINLPSVTCAMLVRVGWS